MQHDEELHTDEGKLGITNKYDKNVEECDKIYFCGFRDNNNCDGHMTLHNLLKTQKAFGAKVANYLKVKNISTRWSSSSRDLTDFFLPNE